MESEEAPYRTKCVTAGLHSCNAVESQIQPALDETVVEIHSIYV